MVYQDKPCRQSDTIKHVVDLKQTQLQTMYVHYKPGTRKYMIKMVRNEPMLDFYDRKAVFQQASKLLMRSDYKRAGLKVMRFQMIR